MLAEIIFLTGLVLFCIGLGATLTIRFLDKIARWTYRDN